MGRNFQDHILVPCVWEYRTPLPSRNGGGEATYFWKSDPSLVTPDLQALMAEFPLTTPEVGLFLAAGGLMVAVAEPRSPRQPREIADHRAKAVRRHRDRGRHPFRPRRHEGADPCGRVLPGSRQFPAMSPLVKREVMPGNLAGSALENFVRNAASTAHHQTCTAKMGRDGMSVVDGRPKVYGSDNLRIADGSILPRVTTGNTMAPRRVIGEKAAAFIKSEAGLAAKLEFANGSR